MKYFTKEFYRMQFLAGASRFVRKSEYAEKKDEEFFKKCYDKKLALFLRNEKMSDWYIDPAEELGKVEAYANEPNISEEERNQRVLYKNAYIAVNKERIESGKFYKLDRELCKRKFEERQRKLVNIYGNLPKEILNKIADIRVFALGYASAEVKALLRPYCAKLKRTLNGIAEKAFSETDEAAKLLTQKIDFNDFGEYDITGVEEKDGDIYLKFKERSLIIKNGKITEGQCKPVYPYNENKPDCPWSRILYAELHSTEDKFELHFLISNSDETEREDLWYLTVSGTDITEV